MPWNFGKGKHDPFKPMFAREHERHQGHGLSCPLGPILDMSASGARVQVAKKPDLQVSDTVTLRVSSGSFCIGTKAQVRWVKRSGRRFEIGFKFLNVTPSLASVLEQLAKYGFVRPETTESSSQSQQQSENPRPADAKSRASPSREKFSAAMEIEDLYAMMGVPRTASDEQIGIAYRALARQFHPDMNPSEEAQAKFVEITKAYRILRDSDKRARYDAMLRQAAAA